MAANIDNRIEGNQLVISLSGRIDSSNAAEVSGQILSAIQAHPDLSWILDADRLDYVSSAGLRIFLSLSKKSPSRVILRNVSSLIYETLSITGFTEILDVKKQLRSISVDGCPEIGRGAIGTVYRLDADTIVKVYQIPDCLPMIENEQKRAKQAFIRGIPTAISYDIVRVGDKYGSVFEMVKAENCNDRLIKDPDHKDDIIQQ
ncbi:MAG: anti-sigma factor antagonist [Clostridia bacterium]|nr:anti-sigma factor antagonist [Clostridia bacterium]